MGDVSGPLGKHTKHTHIFLDLTVFFGAVWAFFWLLDLLWVYVGGREQGARKGLGRITTEQRHRKWRVLWGMGYDDLGYASPLVCSEIVVETI